MIYSFYVAGVAALLAGFVLYRRRKVPKPVSRSYCTLVVPPGGDPIKDGIYFYRRNRTD